jgi:tRNA(fMet)-specific endonuclease VapC
MLDTDTVSYALRGVGMVSERILEHRPSELCVSSVTLAELRFGAAKKRSRKLNKAISGFVKDLAVMAFDDAAADRFGPVAAALERTGTPIGVQDAMLAAHALSLGVTLVTNNTKHFGRVPSLSVANWA